MELNSQLNILRGILLCKGKELLSKVAPVTHHEPPMLDRMRQDIETARRLRTYSTTKNCITAVNALERFFVEQMPVLAEKPVSALTADHLRHFALWNSQRGVCENTIACYMRSLRSIVNRIIPNRTALFASVRTSNVKTRKRAITVDDVRHMETLQLAKGSADEMARDLFLFCIYATGMPLIDAAHIKKSQLRDGCISYYRHKTHAMVNVKVHSELWRLLSRLSVGDSPYLLPILQSYHEETTRREYLRFYQRYSSALRRLSKKLGMEGHVTSYTPRHTWASLAFEIGNELNPIGQALGHTNSNTTLSYIREINDSQVDKVNRSVLAYIKNLKS